MTCASCVNRVEKALKSVKGVVDMNVNFATQRASVEYLSGEATVKGLKQAVQDAGYEVLEVKEEDIVEKERLAREAELIRLKWKSSQGPCFLVPILVLMYGASFLEKWPGLSRGTNFFIQFLLATPVQFWAGRQFYAGFWKALNTRPANEHPDHRGNVGSLSLQSDCNFSASPLYGQGVDAGRLF